MKTELWKKRQAWSGFRPDPQQLSAACQMFRRDANVRENKSVAGSRSLPGRHAAARGSAPREAGTELRGGCGRFLPPGIVPPGSPGLTPAACYFCSKVLAGVNTSPPALGTFLCTGPCQGRGPASAAGARPRVRASAWAAVQPGRSRPAAAGGRIWEGPLRSGHAGAGQSWLPAGRVRGAPAPGMPRPICRAGASRVPAPTPGPIATAAPTSCLCSCPPSPPRAGFALGHGTSCARGGPGYPWQHMPVQAGAASTHGARAKGCVQPQGSRGTGRRCRLG